MVSDCCVRKSISALGCRPKAIGVSAPMVVSMCSRYLSYDIGGGDWRNGSGDEGIHITVKLHHFPTQPKI